MRSIKPNLNQSSDLFDEKYVSSQLISSGSIAYQNLVKTGYPSHMSIADLCQKFVSKKGFKEYICNNQKDFCSILLRACGLQWNYFKIGNTKVFFRDGKIELLTEKLESDADQILFRINKLKMLRSKFYFAILIARIAARFLVMGKFLSN